jgi:hypothetical protein
MAFPVEHTDSIHALFVGDGLHDLVGGFAVIVKHELPSGTSDAPGELIGAQNHRLNELPLLCAEVEITTYGADSNDEDRQGKNQLGAKPSGHRDVTACVPCAARGSTCTVGSIKSLSVTRCGPP